MTDIDKLGEEVAVAGRKGGDIYLSVRKENTVACRFYEKHGMKVVGKVAWSGGTIPGVVYRLALAQCGEQRNSQYF